jgi:amino acid transporter
VGAPARGSGAGAVHGRLHAELVTKYPKAGGAAVFAERAFKIPLLSFLVGFCMLAAGVVSAAGLALTFAGDYLGTFVDVPAIPAAIVFLIFVAASNARGISESLKSNVVMTIVEVTGLLIVIIAVAVMVGDGRRPHRSVPRGLHAGSGDSRWGDHRLLLLRRLRDLGERR